MLCLFYSERVKRRVKVQSVKWGKKKKVGKRMKEDFENNTSNYLCYDVRIIIYLEKEMLGKGGRAGEKKKERGRDTKRETNVCTIAEE